MKILITGGTNGMGKGVAKILAGTDNQVHEVILLCRNKELGESTIKEIEDCTGNNKISLVLCDLSKLSDVRNTVNEIQSKQEFLDCIFVNAGLGYAAKRIETVDGLDPHFQVNYLSQFMLTLNLLNLLENSWNGGRIIFNVTGGGKIFWEDMQMKNKWGYVNGIRQAMTAKRMFLAKLHNVYRNRKNANISFIGFEIPKTVWSNQINIIPLYMKVIATIMKFPGAFISIEKCGEIMSPLFTENQTESLRKSGKFITRKKNEFIEIQEDEIVLNKEAQDRLWNVSLELCNDEKTTQISEKLHTKS